MGGYLVVLKSSSEVATWKRGYCGIDRTPPFSMEDYQSGFDDPLVFGSVTNDAGLAPTRRGAERVLRQFSDVIPAGDLEIIKVREVQRDTIKVAGNDKLLLGFDVAGRNSPFYSVVGDFPGDDVMRHYFEQLNPFGLLPSSEIAYQYLDAYRQQRLADDDLNYTCWAIFRLPGNHIS